MDTRSVSLTGDERTMIAHALNMWKNFIETGDVCLSASDASTRQLKVNALSVDQMKHVIALDSTMKKILW